MRVIPWVLTIVSAVFLSGVHADTHITMKEGNRKASSEEPAQAGQPANKVQVVQIWSRPDDMVRIGENGRMIFSLARGMTYMVNDDKKSCRGFPHPEVGLVSGESDSKTDIRKNGQTRKVGAWQAEGYEMSAKIAGIETPLEITFWVAEELTTGFDVYRANFAGMTTSQTVWMSKMLELGGYPVYQETAMGPMVSWSEIVSVDEEPAPDGIYDIPADYDGCASENS